MKKITAGGKKSTEFSELIVQQPSSHNLRVILYRPSYCDVHKVPISTFFSELADYFESIVLCQEQFSISINIHVDNAVDTDAIQLIDLLLERGLDYF